VPDSITATLHRPLYVADLIVNALNQDPERPLLREFDGSVQTVGDVRDATSRFVQGLTVLGVVSGKRVGVLSANRWEVLHVNNATQILAGTSIAMHPLAGLADHINVARDSGMDLLVFDAERHGQRAAEIASGVDGLRLAGLGPSAFAPDLCAVAAEFAPAPLTAPQVGPDDITHLAYSGGTTGKPKSMAATQRVGLEIYRIMLAEWEWPLPPRVLSCAPLSHAGGTMFIPTLLKGGTMMVLPRFDPLEVLQAVQDHGINCMMLVPTMIYALLDHPRFDEFDLSSLETVFYGASPISPARLREAIQRIGPVFFQFYGQAEAAMSICVLRKSEHDVNDLGRLASCGRPVPWIHVALMGPDNVPVPDGEPGEICVRGPLVMNGYRDTALNTEVFAGDWLHTGDVAIRDAGGFLRIVDRTKDMIVSGGFNIYPREIEDILAEHPAVAQVAVFGVPHPKWGEAVTAAVVLRSGHAPETAELGAMVAKRKGAFQTPKHIVFVDGIPNTPVGKPDKKALRAIWTNALETID
jgi:fatty-acyl-CoA synthase